MKLISIISTLILLSACNIADVIDEFKEEEVAYTDNDANSEITGQLSYPKNIKLGKYEKVKFSVDIPVDSDTSIAVVEFFSHEHELLAIAETFILSGGPQTAKVSLEYEHQGISHEGYLNIRLCYIPFDCDSQTSASTYYTKSEHGQKFYQKLFIDEDNVWLRNDTNVKVAEISVTVNESVVEVNNIPCEPNKKFMAIPYDERNNVYSCYEMTTTFGEIYLATNKEKAPLHSDNFNSYVLSKHYEGTIFHRIVQDFVIQGGGVTSELEEKGPLFSPIKNEANNGLSNLRCTLGAARKVHPDSAQAQFYFNVVDNEFLIDYNESEGKAGYTVFGHVISGMNIVDEMRYVETYSQGGFSDVPVNNIVIEKVTPMDCADFR